MMKSKSNIIVIIGVIINMNCYGQINNFEDILNHPIQNKTILKNENSIESERTFLGSIKDSTGSIIFYVAKEFYATEAAMLRHGHSRIVFFDAYKKLIASYNLDLPEELPYKLINNSLYFRYRTDSNLVARMQKVKIGGKLPNLICVKPDDCYWPDKK